MREIESQNDLMSILRSNGRVFTLFYASWCPFCRSFLPIFEKHAGKSHGIRFLRVKIDDEENPLWAEYDIEVVPTVILFDRGEPKARLDGILGKGLSEEQLKGFLNSKG